MKRFLLTAILVVSVPAHGHDLWLERERDDFALYYGHKYGHKSGHKSGHKDSSHQGSDRLEYDPSWVRETLCFDDAGQKVRFEVREGTPHRITGPCAVVHVLVSSGYWTKTPYGTENVPEAEAHMAIRSWLSRESVKRIDAWSPALAQSLTSELEITPLNDPKSLRKGQKLRLQLTFSRDPVAGVVVTYDGEPRGQTGRDGRINIRLRHGGFQVIQASLRRPDVSGKADEIVHSANLNFELGEE